MALFDDASLVVTPNGYKAGTLYSIKPTSGAGDMTVVRATTATRVNSAGLIESVAINVPRLDYTDSTCPSLLLEPQRTNLALYSEQFTNAVWTASAFNVSIISNTTISPDGTQNADTVVFGASGYLYQQFAITGLASVTFSIYSKTATQVIIFGGGTPVGTDVYTTVNVGNGWFRQILVRTFTSGGTGTLQILPFGNNITAFLWGCQLEVGNYPTSYIPTTSAAVTRNADKISKTGISSLINSTEGVLYAEINTNTDSTDKVFSINNGISGSGNSRLWMGYSTASKNVYALGYVNNTLQFVFSKTMTDESIFVKIACKYAVNDAAFYVNGVQEGTDTSALAFSGLNSFNFNIGTGAGAAANFYGNVKQILIFPTVLTDAQLAELTTL
jgi:hypothetical protein